jgi:hypothetical protein
MFFFSDRKKNQFPHAGIIKSDLYKVNEASALKPWRLPQPAPQPMHATY